MKGVGIKESAAIERSRKGKLKESAFIHDSRMPFLTSKHFKGYVQDDKQICIATTRHPVGADRFTEVKVIHSGSVHHTRQEVTRIQNNLDVQTQFRRQGILKP